MRMHGRVTHSVCRGAWFLRWFICGLMLWLSGGAWLGAVDSDWDFGNREGEWVQPAAAAPLVQMLLEVPPDLAKIRQLLVEKPELRDVTISFHVLLNPADESDWSGSVTGSPLLIGVQQDNPKLLGCLLEAGCGDKPGKRSKNQAFAFCMSEICRPQYKEGAEPDRPHLKRLRQMAEVLLAHGANPDTRDPLRRGYLELALSNDYDADADLLLAHGADVDLHDNHGNTPLADMVAYQNEGKIRYLLEHGADPRGRTAILRDAGERMGMFQHLRADLCEGRASRETFYNTGLLSGTTIQLYWACKPVPDWLELLVTLSCALCGVMYLRWRGRLWAADAEEADAIEQRLQARFTHGSSWDTTAALPDAAEFEAYVAGELRYRQVKNWLALAYWWVVPAWIFYLLDPLLIYVVPGWVYLGLLVYLGLHLLHRIEAPQWRRVVNSVMIGATVVALMNLLYLLALLRMNFGDLMQVIKHAAFCAGGVVHLVVHARLYRISGTMADTGRRLAAVVEREARADLELDPSWDQA